MFIILVLLQAIIFNHICLFHVAVPFVFIFFIIKLPLDISQNAILTLGFLLGLVIDIFSDTQGMNALCCTIIAACRGTIIRLYCPREDEITAPEPSARALGLFSFLKYALTITLLYCILYFLIESLIILNPATLLIKIAASTLLTFAIIVAADMLTLPRHEKRL